MLLTWYDLDVMTTIAGLVRVATTAVIAVSKCLEDVTVTTRIDNIFLMVLTLEILITWRKS